MFHRQYLSFSWENKQNLSIRHGNPLAQKRRGSEMSERQSGKAATCEKIAS
jgi:hypothetical protein